MYEVRLDVKVERERERERLTEKLTKVNPLLQVMECYLQKVVTVGPGMSLDGHYGECSHIHNNIGQPQRNVSHATTLLQR